jgi:hypothetical protein
LGVAITIERKPSERGTSSLAAAPAGQCCCCCCCCLHTVGSVIGAVTAKPDLKIEGPLPVATAEKATLEQKNSAAGLYWAIVSIATGLIISYFAGIEHDNVRFEDVLLMIALFLPGAQLAASVVAAIMISSSKRIGKEARLRHLGRITLRAFLGTVIGILIMLVVFAGFK